MITKENFTSLKFQCTECKTYLSWHDINDVIREYGLIALIKGFTDFGYFGYTCPSCKTTILHKTNKDFLKVILFKIFNKPDISSSYFYRRISRHQIKQENTLSYFSNIESLRYNMQYGVEEWSLKEETPSVVLYGYSHDLIKYVRSINDTDLNRQDVFSNCYYSYMLHSFFIEPVPITQIFVFDPNDPENHKKVIRTFQKIENEQKIKIFNRYILLDPLYPLINKFHIEYGKYRPINERGNIYEPDNSLNVRDHALNLYRIKTKKDKHDQESINDHIDEELKKLISHNNKQFSIMKTSSFLNTLCIPNIERYIDYPKKSTIKETLFPTHFMEIDFLELQQMYEKIWSNFHNNNLQNLLMLMADNFLHEYFIMSRQTDCSFQKVSELRQRYLYDIYDSIKTPQKMIQKKQKATIKYSAKIQILEEPYPALKKIISHDYEINKIKENLMIFLKSDLIDSCLLLGETGTGKELFAKAIHEISGRSGDYVTVNCASIPNKLFESVFFGHAKGSFTGADKDKIGYFEQANGGTIFLDEIGELDLNNQARFLRVLQERKITPVGKNNSKKIDFLLISATNRNLNDMINEGRFREDLYQRIKLLPIKIPALAKRENDIELLIQHFINKYDIELKKDSKLEPLIIDKDCLNTLSKYSWPGNVRELENTCKLVMIHHMVSKGRSTIDISEFSLEKEAVPTKGVKSHKIKQESAGPGNTKVTNDQIKEALANHNGNKTKAAEELGVTYATILRRSKKFDI